MNEEEHLEIARRLAELSDRLYQDGDDVAAAEMLWGAANRAINAIALRHMLDNDGQLPRRGAVIHYLISSRLVSANIQDGMYAARALHGHFYNSHLDAAGVAERVADTKSFIADLLNLYHQNGRR